MGAKKLNALDQSIRFFDYYLNCYEYSHILKQTLFSVLSQSGLSNVDRPVLKKLLINLAVVPEGAALALPLNHEYYSAQELRNAGLSRYKVSKVLNALIAAKFVAVVKGSEATGVSRVYSLHKLKGHFKHFTNAIYLEKKDAGQIVLRDKAKNDLCIPHNDLTTQLIQDVSSINEHLLKFKYQAMDRRFFPQLTRVFNLNFESGGRFYCHIYQSLSHRGGQRQTILIDDKKTCELDFKAMHPTMLYSHVGAALPNDPYSINSALRSDAKIAFNTMLNADSPGSAKGAIQHNLKMTQVYTEQQCEQIMSELELLNAPIAQYLNTGVGIKLQYYESVLCEAILLESVMANKPVLPIHDSYICKEEDEEWLRELMLRKGKECLGIDLKIDKK